MSYTSKSLDYLGLLSAHWDGLRLTALIDKLLPRFSSHTHLSFGQSIKAMVLNGLGYMNHRLYLVEDFFTAKPTDILLGPGVEPSHLNDDLLGRSLDAIFTYGCSELFSQLSSHVVKTQGIRIDSGHLDSTQFHVHGSYNSSEAPNDSKVIHITHGYSKDHRPDLNQVGLHLICSQQGSIPLMMRCVNGNSSDSVDFRKSVSLHVSQLQNDYNLPYIVADSKLYSRKSLEDFKDQGLYWISRIPLNMTRSKELVASSELKDFSPLSAEGYQGKWVEVELHGISQRWLVLHSQQAQQSKESSFVRKVGKALEKRKQLFKTLQSTVYHCHKDAQKALDRFIQQGKYTQVAKAAIVSKQDKGSKQNQKQQSPTYVIQGEVIQDSNKVEKAKQRLGFFILGTNQLDQQEIDADTLLSYYKGNDSTERGFRFLKDPRVVASSFFVQKPQRVMALLMVMTLCLLIYASLEWHIRNKLKEQKQTFPNQVKKEVQNPTLRWICQCFMGIHILYMQGKPTAILNLSDRQRRLLDILKGKFKEIYTIKTSENKK